MTDATKTNKLNSSKEHQAITFNGYFILLISVSLLGAGVWVLLSQTVGETLSFLQATSAVLCLGAGVLGFKGFYMIQPNQAVAVMLFGSYRGTDRYEGLRWTWPWMVKTKISVRSNN